ncbi:YTH domain-containing protein ECT2-like isoform X1 [Spinacia oleracea]|uniref:YTH domain-containing protein ECT2-like isoform X1 n=1 Tax=Spinacia oleracea TaxID=3562 RepID=A0ABM3QNI7_SPIOL|nr:YTH domain-containing protein ECT2-like isoform X1 [Spinacia oleracea]XP_056684920.1 YTH domain-containing protein ECT2-like isoform X1 [Spinacia oleracea]XP_056684921.1 YTH domain-containing protein ECT2-like isoform X1 [Spinacia oleracea]XP_056684922.1 YTH domain-containing protein ECT2-like isoform X1 [Spinacia oleracea]XP_056684923.1 YTH domain-containing protein ECT2-like isoform X1 [Spinacia oleracea]XP_056684924.1 YTH domain-containing protein ECT2-like isoform X1 [Spinacia oleracea]
MNMTRILAFKNKPPTHVEFMPQDYASVHQSKPVKPRKHIRQARVMSLHQPRLMSSLGAAQGYINRMYSSKLYGPYTSGDVRAGFGNNGYDARVNDRAWFAVDNKFRNKSRGNGFLGYGDENMDGLNELNRGPIAKASKSIRIGKGRHRRSL